MKITLDTIPILIESVQGLCDKLTLENLCTLSVTSTGDINVERSILQLGVLCTKLLTRSTREKFDFVMILHY